MTIRAHLTTYLFSVSHGTDGGDHVAFRHTQMFRYWVQILEIMGIMSQTPGETAVFPIDNEFLASLDLRFTGM